MFIHLVSERITVCIGSHKTLLKSERDFPGKWLFLDFLLSILVQLCCSLSEEERLHQEGFLKLQMVTCSEQISGVFAL